RTCLTNAPALSGRTNKKRDVNISPRKSQPFLSETKVRAEQEGARRTGIVAVTTLVDGCYIFFIEEIVGIHPQCQVFRNLVRNHRIYQRVGLSFRRRDRKSTRLNSSHVKI